VPNQVNQRDNRFSWFSAIIIGVAVFAILFWYVEPRQVLDQFGQVDIGLLAFAFLPLAIEAMCSTFRIQHCVNHTVSIRLAAYCNSLYLIWLSLLPARLGEIAGIAVFHKRLSMPLGSAVASVIVQRIYDVLILSGSLIIVLSQTYYGGDTALVIASIALVALIGVLLTLPFWLGMSAKVLLSWRHKKWVKHLLYALLQARTWYRHQSEPRAVLWLTGTTIGKWCFNLVAITTVFTACGIELDLPMLVTLAIIMHFLGAIPIHSVGGFGASELGLTGMLVSLGTPVDQAVATSLIVRLISLCFCFLFFVVASLVARNHRYYESVIGK
jgi:uncharacterized protein (TIRG00374 family)